MTFVVPEDAEAIGISLWVEWGGQSALFHSAEIRLTLLCTADWTKQRGGDES
jgi:hypothetical protein